MVILEISKSHEDSPDFRSGLTKLEGITGDLERRLKRLCTLCDERQQAAERERQLTQELVTEFEGLAETSLDGSSNITSSVEVITTALKQLIDNQERMFEQINIGIVKPLTHFLSRDLEQLRSSKKTYKKARNEATQAAEKFCQCKKYEMGVMTEMSAHLFEARYDLHKAACNYAMDLNLVQSKRVPDFLQRVVDFMTTQLSYFYLGNITVKDTEPHITTLYSTLESLRREATTRDTQQRSEAIQLLEQQAVTSAKKLLHLQIHDLHIPTDTAKANVSRLMTKVLPSSTGLDLTMEPTVQTDDVTKHGYLCYAEPRTFGTAWIRLYFHIENEQLISQESKVKVPISLSLNVCNVKPAEPVDTERNFCFKVTSPTRTLLLQAESSRAMKEWMDVLTNAITHALYAVRHSLTPERESVRGPGDESPMPVKPPRPKRKSILLKDIYSAAGNEVCADCGAPSPKWASVNLGVVLCIECSGVHRSLGVYISQARSLTLDTLKPEWVAKLKAVGNTKSNSVYEKTLPDDFDRAAIRKADGRREFITNKYTNMLYTSEEDKQRITEKRQAARAESLKKSGVHTSNGGTKDELEDGWVKVNKDDTQTEHEASALESHDPPTPSPDPCTDTPEPSHDQPEASHDPADVSHDQPEGSHDTPDDLPETSHDLPTETQTIT